MSSSMGRHNDRSDRRHDSRRSDAKRATDDDRSRRDERRHKHSDHSSSRHKTHDKEKDRKRDRKDRSSSKSRKEHRKRRRSDSHSDRSRSRRRSRSRGSVSSAPSDSSDGGMCSDDQRLTLISRRLEENHKEVLAEKQRSIDKYKEDKRRQKETLKSLETPEEKRMRRLAKKEAKERKRKMDSGWDEEYMGYTNADNPFGDANLHKTFIWGKKFDKMGLKDVSEEEIEKMNRKKMEKTKVELEKVKQRRLESEREKELRADEVQRQQREKEADQFKEWEKQEDVFHLKQAKIRSKLRIKEGRAKPIDLLARYISTYGHNVKEEGEEDIEEPEEIATDLVEPYLCLNGLRITDLDDLFEDINVYMTLDIDLNLDFWKDLQIIVEDELNKLKKCHKQSDVERREGINPAVSQDVVNVFKDKTPAQLQALQSQIETKIRSNEEGIDIGYWESLLSRLKAHIARARLREFHDMNLNKRLNRLREEQLIHQSNQQIPNEPLFPIIDNKTHLKTDESEETATTSQAFADDQTQEVSAEETDPLVKCVDDYEMGHYSPKPLSSSDNDSEVLVIEMEEDMRQLNEQRKRVLGVESLESRVRSAAMNAAEQAFEREARKGMTNDEVQFSVEEQIVKIDKQYSWSDKYRPRKPRYFNRVHTGFEWNKYNQTHYDVDNPPPKVVQGYKFNIFYPDLIDKSNTPTYKITPCPDNRDFAFIRFNAGPPYEDICFKIVNREWNYSYKSGFRSQFHNNILQLWFHFKRYRYRR